MSSFGVVLDACVLVAAPVRDTLLRAAERGLYRPHWSEDILAEVHRVLVREQMTTEQKASSLIATLLNAFPEALVEDYAPLIDSMTNDRDDRHVLAAAVHAGAQVIVTNNARHFPDDSVARYGIEVLTPDDYLLDLFDLEPAVLSEIVRRQGEALRTPRSAAQVCAVLARHAPEFAKAVLIEIAEDVSQLEDVD